MTEYAYSHYDIDHEARGKTMMVLDAFRMMAESIDNDALAASREDPTTMGIENPASNLGLKQSKYTTLPLHPISQDCNFIFNNYITVDFELTLTPSIVDDEGTANLNPIGDTDYFIDYAVYFPSAACTPNRVQLLLGNSIVWQNQFQRQEACVVSASIPQQVLETDPQYVTMDKLRRRTEIPGAYFTLRVPKEGAASLEFKPVTVHFKYNIDVDHLTPLLSNIPFTSPEMGDLRLRLFFDDFASGLCVTPLELHTGTTESYTGSYDVTGPFERYPLNKRVRVWNSSDTNITWDLTDWHAKDLGVSITQANFRLKQTSRDLLKAYIAQDNKLVIPTQTWSTALSNAGVQNLNLASSAELVWQISAYNIYLLAILFPFNTAATTYYPNPRFRNINVSLNGKSINYTPYPYFDNRFAKDVVQAMLNDDKYGAGSNLIDSLRLSNTSNTIYPSAEWNSCVLYPDNIQNGDATAGELYNRPNNFVLAHVLSPPNSFEKGYCNAASNPQATQVRVVFTQASDDMTGCNPSAPGYFANNDKSFKKFNADATHAMCLALQDCCLVLTFNPAVGTCQSGEIVYQEPFVVGA